MRRPFLAVLFALAVGCSPARVSASAIPTFDAAAAWNYLVAQVDFGPRVPGTPQHAACAKWMLQLLRERADVVQPHVFVFDDPYGEENVQATNIRVSFRPELEPRIAIAAHWDSRPRADRDEDPARVDEPIPGANDGASGVAVLLALADLFADTPPPVGVDLLFFDAEDWGEEGDPEHYLIGSRRYVQDHPRYRPRALILLDLVGDADLRIPMEGYSLQAAPSLTSMVFQRAMALGLPAFDPVRGQAVLDDHVPFLQAGVPAVDLIDFDYPHWHTTADTVDKCSQDSLDQVGRLVVALLWMDFAAGH